MKWKEGILLKQKCMMLLSLLLVLVLSAGICSAKAKDEEKAAAAQQQATLTKVQQANALCDKFACRYDEEAKGYVFSPKPEVLGRLSGKAAAVIPSVTLAEKDDAVSFRMLFSYAGLEFLDFKEVALVMNGKPDRASSAPPAARAKNIGRARGRRPANTNTAISSTGKPTPRTFGRSSSAEAALTSVNRART